MQISEQVLNDTMLEFFGPLKKSSKLADVPFTEEL